MPSRIRSSPKSKSSHLCRAEFPLRPALRFLRQSPADRNAARQLVSDVFVIHAVSFIIREICDFHLTVYAIYCVRNILCTLYTKGDPLMNAAIEVTGLYKRRPPLNRHHSNRTL